MRVDSKKLKKNKSRLPKKTMIILLSLLLINLTWFSIYLFFIEPQQLFANTENNKGKFFKSEISLLYGYETRFNKVIRDDNQILAVGSFLKNSSEKYQIVVVSLDNEGKEQWRREFGGSGNEWGFDILKNGDNYLVLGVTSSKEFGVRGRYDALLILIDSNGNILWSRVYGGPNSDGAYKILKVKDGYVFIGDNYMKGGDVFENFGEYDYWIVKVNDVGDLIWSKSFGGTRWDRASSADYDPENDIIVVTGFSNSFTGGVRYDGYTIAYNSKGQKLWECAFFNLRSIFPLDICISKSGIFVGGYVYEDGKEKSFVAKISKLGRVDYMKVFSENTRINSLKVIQDDEEKVTIAFSGYKDTGTKQLWHGQLILPSGLENSQPVLIEYPIQSLYGSFLSTCLDDEFVFLTGTNLVNGKMVGYIRVFPR